MKDMHASTLEKINLPYGYHLNCILDNYSIQQYIPYHICLVVVIKLFRLSWKNPGSYTLVFTVLSYSET